MKSRFLLMLFFLTFGFNWCFSQKNAKKNKVGKYKRIESVIVRENPNAKSRGASVSTGSFVSRDSLARLKAVFIVGPVESSTAEFIDEQKVAAAMLRAQGLQVIEVYSPFANWELVKEKAKDAHILIYSGHGSTAGYDGKSGGFCLDDDIINASRIATELQIKKNALIVMNHVCRAAGSSAEDSRDIGVTVAQSRVSDYSKPFINLGSSAYFANNYTDCLSSFFTSFLERKNIVDIYKVEAEEWNKVEFIQQLTENPQYSIGISSTDMWSFKSYEIAFVGKPNFTIKDLFK
jgi:hypothetical protein